MSELSQRLRSLALHTAGLVSAGGLVVGCAASQDPDDPAADDAATDGAETGDGSSGGSEGGADTGMADAADGAESDGGATPATCVPPPLLVLGDIPDDPSLDPSDPDIVATFEVDGHKLIGKHVIDEAAAEGGLKLWQEVMLRIPENQLLDLVQLDISLDDDPVAYFNRTGDVTTSRLGLKIGFSVETFAINQDDPCAPLEPRRGTFDWSLVHEFGHLRGFVDGSWDKFLDTFPNVEGDGEGYPEDGSPILTGDFVTSYAERADGDEDHAESWTTYVMLPETDIPAPTPDEPLALQKVRWMDQQPGLRALRNALRVTEPDAVMADVPPAPRLDTSVFGPDDAEVVVPPPLHGQWRQSPADGYVVTFTSDDIVLAREEGGALVESLSLGDEQAAGALDYFEIHGGAPTLAYSYILQPGSDRHNHDFFLQEDPTEVVFKRERLDADSGELEYLPELTLSRVP